LVSGSGEMLPKLAKTGAIQSSHKVTQ